MITSFYQFLIQFFIFYFQNDKFERIKGELIKTRTLYNDPEFPTARSSIGSEEYLLGKEGAIGRIQWKRPWVGFMGIVKDYAIICF